MSLRLQHYISGKRVAIVGNAESLIGRGYGHEIDLANTVVRINLWKPKEHETKHINKIIDTINTSK